MIAIPWYTYCNLTRYGRGFWLRYRSSTRFFLLKQNTVFVCNVTCRFCCIFHIHFVGFAETICNISAFVQGKFIIYIVWIQFEFYVVVFFVLFLFLYFYCINAANGGTVKNAFRFSSKCNGCACIREHS